MKRWTWVMAGLGILGLTRCDWLKEALPTLTVYAVFGEVGPATGPLEQLLGISLPTEGVDPQVQTVVVYLADENGVVSDAEVLLDGRALPFQDSVDLYFVPIQDTVPVPAPVNVFFGSSVLKITRGGQTVELQVPEGATLEDPVVAPDTVRIGQPFTVGFSFSGEADSVVVQLSGGGVQFDTTLIPQAGTLSVEIPGSVTADLTQETLLNLSVVAFHAVPGGGGVTPVSLRLVVRSKVVPVPVVP